MLNGSRSADGTADSISANASEGRRCGGRRGGKDPRADAWKFARAIWDKLRLKVETTPAAQDAALDAAEVPDDPDAVAAFRYQLKKLLTDDEALARDVGLLLDEAKAGNVTITASGDRSVAGQNISDTVIITGDQ